MTEEWEHFFRRKGLEPGELPETLEYHSSGCDPAVYTGSYMEAGSDIVLTNTFGANALKFHDDSCSLKEIVQCGRGTCKGCGGAVREGRMLYLTALDVGPTGKLLKTNGRPGI